MIRGGSARGFTLEDQLLADDYARNGFKVYAPDFFGNDSVHPDALNPGSTFDLMNWLSKHPPESKLPIIRNVIAALKAQGITKIGALGFCYGARPAFDLAFTNEIDVVAVAHPSLLKVPEDLEVRIQHSAHVVAQRPTAIQILRRNTPRSPRRPSSSTHAKLTACSLQRPRRKQTRSSAVGSSLLGMSGRTGTVASTALLSVETLYVLLMHL